MCAPKNNNISPNAPWCCAAMLLLVGLLLYAVISCCVSFLFITTDASHFTCFRSDSPKTNDVHWHFAYNKFSINKFLSILLNTNARRKQQTVVKETSAIQCVRFHLSDCFIFKLISVGFCEIHLNIKEISEREKRWITIKKNYFHETSIGEKKIGTGTDD